MFIIDDLIFAAVAIAVGTAAAKGTTKFREFMNEGESVYCKCVYCQTECYNQFSKIDRSDSSMVIGLLSGGIGGVVSGMVAGKLYICSNCGNLIKEDGSEPGWNAGDALEYAIENFIDYPELGKYYEELASLIERNKIIEHKYRKEIDYLNEKLNQKDIDNIKLTDEVRRLIDKIKRDNNLY